LHEASHAHKETTSTWPSPGNQPLLLAQSNSHLHQSQKHRRQGLFPEIEAVRYLACQGIAFRNHNECEGNLHRLLLLLSEDSKECVGPAWFSVIADEATDIASSEQMSIVIRWVSDNYDIHEDPIGLFKVPNTTAKTLFTIIKDILIRYNLPLSLCRGQAYDVASNMQGKRKGVATRLRNAATRSCSRALLCSLLESFPPRC